MTSNSSWLATVAETIDGAWYVPFLVALVAFGLILGVRAAVPTLRPATVVRRRPVASPYPGRHVAPPGYRPAQPGDLVRRTRP
ncbi:hypothetical protein [Hamadaea tsunoensis]|uniref:hypothetical protein n=1 Tax=Hamadaea tsunoensis TaxID=53368 RepID=UPI0004167824|nr:hypothetical protein [Hamadaea tsunoensis]